MAALTIGVRCAWKITNQNGINCVFEARGSRVLFGRKRLGIAYDTSGIDPAMDLTLIGSVRWLSSYGLEFTGGRAFSSTFNSTKLKNFLQATKEYAIEAWVIPDNVTQENRSIISYSGSGSDQNFSLSQTMYNYEFYNRIDIDPAQDDGGPVMSTVDAGEILQATLQHVVVNYSPINGREIYVNGERISVTDPVVGQTTAAPVWDSGFSFLIGNRTGGSTATEWLGKVRFASVHSRTLSEEQVQQNYEVGVGEKRFLLFSVAHRTGIDDTYVAMQVSQIDEYGYLFETPFFINLDPDWTPVPIDIKGMRIAVNGTESRSGQAFASIDATINVTDDYVPGLGQVLSRQGAIIPIDKGIENDEFFLTFEKIDSFSRTFTDIRPTAPAPVNNPGEIDDPNTILFSSDIGLRTFEEIHATIAEITGIGMDNSVVKGVYDELKQQLPSSSAFGSFVPAHQIAIAQLAMASCDQLVASDLGQANPADQFFTDFDFSISYDSSFTTDVDSATDRSSIIDPLLVAVMNVNANSDNNLTSQPDQGEVVALLGQTADFPLADDLDPDTEDLYRSLISQLLANPASTDSDGTDRTEDIVKAVCAAAVGGAVMLVQ